MEENQSADKRRAWVLLVKHAPAKRLCVRMSFLGNVSRLASVCKKDRRQKKANHDSVKHRVSH